LISRSRVIAATAVVLAAGAGLSGCQSASRALGLQRVTPDEFRVVAKAPLTLPPDYALRPPIPGEPRPQELQPESAAREALLGRRASENRSEGERLLANKAGADRADPLIRYVVDDEYGDLAYKEKSFADRVMFWRKDQAYVQAPTGQVAVDPGAVTPAPIDPAAEQSRVAAATGGGKVVIQRRPATGRKLPGL
jgi:hypothetical protein